VEVLDWRAVIVDDWGRTYSGVVLLVNHLCNERALAFCIPNSESWINAYRGLPKPIIGPLTCKSRYPSKYQSFVLLQEV